MRYYEHDGRKIDIAECKMAYVVKPKKTKC